MDDTNSNSGSTTRERTSVLDFSEENDTNYLGVYLPDLD
jgi:hypothetical protein